MYKIRDYINISDITERVALLDNINRQIDYSKLEGTSLIKQEDLLEFAATNTIEGDDISLSQAKAFLRNEESLNKAQLEKRWIGIKHASDYIWSERFSFDEENIHQTHRALLREVEMGGGVYKQKINQVGSLVTSHPEDVPLLMTKLYYALLDAKHKEELSVYSIIPFLSEFLAIHPYEDGNGRISRLLSNWLLHDAGYKFTKYVSVSKFLLERKKEYIAALEYRNSSWARKTLSPQDLKPLFIVILDTLIEAAKYAKAISLLKDINIEEFTKEIMKLKEFSFVELRKHIVSSKSDATYKKWIKELLSSKRLTKVGELKNTRYIVNN